MKGYIVYQTYKVINERAYVFLFGRLENKQSFLTMNYYRPYFYIREKDLKKAQKVENFDFEKSDFKNFTAENLVKILLDVPGDVPTLRHSLYENEIETFESDIRFPTRFLIDYNIKATIDIDGDYTQEGSIDRIYKDPDLKPVEFIPELKILSIDIETSSNLKNLYSISLYSKNYKKTFIVSKKKFKNTLSFKNEESLLESFQEELVDFDPDVIVGWNLIDFDLKYLANKFKKHEIRFVLGRDNTTSKLRLEKDFFRDSKADFTGRQVLDGIHLLKNNFVVLSDYKLNTAAKEILNEEKLLQDENKGQEIEDLYKKNQQKLIDYNVKDTVLTYDIIKKSNAYDIAIQKSLITGMPLDRVSASISSLDSLYLSKARERKIVSPNSKFEKKDKGITGGYVMDSVPGIYDNVLILDFKSLYPSLMRTFNIDPLSYLGQETKEKNTIKAPNGAYFRNTNGVMPEVLEELFKVREKATKEKNEQSRYAIKILMNSFFGVLANPTCRFYNYNIANAITHFGQFLIKLTAKEIEKEGYKVIYSDTDSVFVLSKKKSLKDAESLGKELEKKLNEFFKSYIKKKYKRESHLELEYEKCFIKFLMPSIRGGKGAAKKRYAGLLLKNKKEEIELTGLEGIRSDWTELAKKFQYELLDKAFHNKKVEDFIKNFIKNVNSGKYDDLLVYRKSIRKNLEDYVKIQPPHVKAARKLKKLTSTKIEYVLTEDGPEPIQDIKHKLDYDHYIKKQLKPIADTILVFIKKDFDTIVKETKQHSLSEF